MVQTETIPLADALIGRFKATFKGLPKWAWRFNPSVPLVGERYRPGRNRQRISSGIRYWGIVAVHGNKQSMGKRAYLGEGVEMRDHGSLSLAA